MQKYANFRVKFLIIKLIYIICNIIMQKYAKVYLTFPKIEL